MMPTATPPPPPPPIQTPPSPPPPPLRTFHPLAHSRLIPIQHTGHRRFRRPVFIPPRQPIVFRHPPGQRARQRLTAYDQLPERPFGDLSQRRQMAGRQLHRLRPAFRYHSLDE